jgi:hypothetical protein
MESPETLPEFQAAFPDEEAWVLSLPYALRYRLAYDAPLTSAVLGVFVRAVFASPRRRARKQWGVRRGLSLPSFDEAPVR